MTGVLNNWAADGRMVVSTPPSVIHLTKDFCAVDIRSNSNSADNKLWILTYHAKTSIWLP